MQTSVGRIRDGQSSLYEQKLLKITELFVNEQKEPLNF